MPDLKVIAANLAWMTSCLPAYLSFRGAMRDPHHAQTQVLREIIARNVSTEFGSKHRFADIRTVADFRARVPETNYESLSPFIDRACAGEQNVLTTDRVELFEKTSGSSAAAKYIPYTKSLRREFQKAVRTWIFNLYRHDPQLLLGQSYWLITPLSRDKEMTSCGIPVGFENDADYLGTLERRIAEALFAVPGELAKIPDIESSLYLTLRFLIQAENLSLISFWNPSYLSLIMDRFDSWADRLLADLESGTALVPSEQGLSPSLTRKLRAQPQRARTLRWILARTGCLRPADLWPGLRLISCWTDAAARQSLEGVRQRFPRVRIQGKGLLATEGVVTIPWVQAGGCIPALTSHFYEFLPLGGGPCRLAHELEEAAEYSLLLTTGGGLYRYRLGDRVRVKAFHGSVPVLEFVGRNDGVSDLCGEKLSPAFVQSCLDQASAEVAAQASFAMLAPQPAASRYILYIECLSNPQRLGEVLESKLRANPHYDYCRRLGQLDTLQVFWIRGNAQQVYLQRCAELGQRAGSVKPTSLHRAGGWEEYFSGDLITNHHGELAHADR